MLLLCSNGLTSQHLLEQLREYTANCKTAALVVTADPVYKAKNYHVSRCVQELEMLGLAVDILDIDTEDPSRLLHYDVVEFIGGNPFYLLSSIQKRNAGNILRTVSRDKILIGWSAAAFVFGPSLELVNRYSPEMNVAGITNLTALGLTETEVLPHYDRFLTKFENFEETCRDYEITHNTSVLRLKDGDGIFLHVSKSAPHQSLPCVKGGGTA